MRRKSFTLIGVIMSIFVITITSVMPSPVKAVASGPWCTGRDQCPAGWTYTYPAVSSCGTSLGLCSQPLVQSVLPGSSAGLLPLIGSQCFSQDSSFTNVSSIDVGDFLGDGKYKWLEHGANRNPAFINAVLKLGGEQAFFGYPARFGDAYTGETHWVLVLNKSSGLPNYISESDAGGKALLMAWTNWHWWNQNTDANGQHLGNHPCSAIGIPKAQWDQLIRDAAHK